MEELYKWEFKTRCSYCNEEAKMLCFATSRCRYTTVIHPHLKHKKPRVYWLRLHTEPASFKNRLLEINKKIIEEDKMLYSSSKD